jgi:uncharacterized protein YndB with AHSA1/START domain
MSIAPIMHSVQVKAEPKRAFELFTGRISDWWPKGKTPGKQPHAAIILDPKQGGRWGERDADGNEAQWGQVLVWEPPSRLVLGWQLNSQWRYDPDLLTEVELTFSPAAGGGTLVRLEHRNLERFGADMSKMVESINGGWPSRLADFVAYVAARAA